MKKYRRCRVCSKKLPPYQKSFCSDDCIKAAIASGMKLPTWLQERLTNCHSCGKLMLSGNYNRKYCSADCKRINGHGKREAIPRRVRLIIFRRDRSTCVYCGAFAEVIDHVHPVVAGGRTAESNLVSACFSCNSAASGKVFSTIEEKKNYILAKRGINKKEFWDERDEFIRPAWHAKVYGAG